MDETKISIAELEEMVTKWDAVDPTTVTLPDVADDLVAVANAAPALIAIVKAAMVHIDAHDNEVLSGDAFYKAVADTRQELRKALRAVRP